MKFSDHLRALRGYNTQQDLAALLGDDFSVRTLEAWESERRTPPRWIQRLVISHLQDSIEAKRGMSWRPVSR